MSSFDLSPASTALVLIDLQNGILGYPLQPHSPALVIDNANKLIPALREEGATILFVRVALNDMLHLPVDQPTRSANAPQPPPEASEFVAHLDRQPTDLVVTKRQWGAFYGTELDQQLRRRGIKTIVLGGIATNFGVESTARAAFDHGYQLVFAEDAMTSLSPEAHQFATQAIFPRMGRVRTTAQILEALKAEALQS